MARSRLRRPVPGRRFALATVASALASPLAAWGQTWSPPTLLSTAAEYNGGSGQLKEPNLTPATGGGFHVVYHVGNNGDIKYRRINAGSYSLGTYTPVYDGLFTANTNITQTGDGSVVIGWERWNEAGVGASGKAEIGIAKLNSAGVVQSIGTPQGVSATNGFAKYPQLSSYGQAADGRVMLSYYNSSTDALHSRTSSDAGVTFGPDSVLQTADIEYRVMGIAKSPVDGSVWRAYGTDNGNDTFNLKMVKFDAASQTWGAPVNIISNQPHNNYPSRMSLAVSHTGKVCVAWDSAKRWGNNSGVSAQVYSPESNSWTPELQVFSATPFFGNVAAVPGADNAFYVFNTNNAARDFPIVVNITNGVVNRVDEKPGGVGTYTTADFTPYVRGGIDATGKVMAAWELWTSAGAAGGTLNPQLFYSTRDNRVYEAGVWLGGAGNWSDAAKWAGMDVPNAAAMNVRLDNNSPAVSTTSLDQDATVGSIQLNSADTFNVNATRTLTVTGAQASTLAGIVNNSGTIAVQAGTISLAGGGDHTGVFNVAAGATLEFASGTHALKHLPFTAFAGAGDVKLSGGTLEAPLGFIVNNRTFRITGGTLNVTGPDGVSTNADGAAVQSGGVHNASTFSIGLSAGFTGTYQLSGTDQLNTTDTFIGVAGSGVFTQSGGTHNVPGRLGISPQSPSTSSYTLSGGTLSAGTIEIGARGTFNYDGGSIAATDVTMSGGTLNIGANTLNVSVSPFGNGGRLQVGSGATVNATTGVVNAARGYLLLDGTVNAALAGAGTISKSSGGTVTLTRANTFMGGTSVTGGTLVAANPDSFGAGGVSVSDGAVARVQPGLARALSLASVSTSGSGVLDLTDNPAVIRNMTVAQVQAAVASAFAAGTWNGPGLTSSTASADAAHVTAVGVAGNAVLGKSSFEGLGGLAASDVLVKYTYYGDADLSGSTTLDDFTLFLNGYQSAGNTWFQGDFDYNGVVTLDDFTLFLLGYENQGRPLTLLEGAVSAAHQLTEAERASMLAAILAVPEPGGASLLGIALLGAIRRRRR